MQTEAFLKSTEDVLVCVRRHYRSRDEQAMHLGTKIATQVLHDGDLVEVDANKGVMKVLKRAGK